MTTPGGFTLTAGRLQISRPVSRSDSQAPSRWFSVVCPIGRPGPSIWGAVSYIGSEGGRTGLSVRSRCSVRNGGSFMAEKGKTPAGRVARGIVQRLESLERAGVTHVRKPRAVASAGKAAPSVASPAAARPATTGPVPTKPGPARGRRSWSHRWPPQRPPHRPSPRPPASPRIGLRPWRRWLPGSRGVPGARSWPERGPRPSSAWAIPMPGWCSWARPRARTKTGRGSPSSAGRVNS